LQSEKPFEQENAERTEFLLCCLRALLFQNASSASIRVNLRAKAFLPEFAAVQKTLPF
jgi:hypothetical protein